MRGILNDHELVLVCQVDQLRIEFARRNLAGRTVGIIDHQHLGAFPSFIGNLAEIRIEMILSQ